MILNVLNLSRQIYTGKGAAEDADDDPEMAIDRSVDKMHREFREIESQRDEQERDDGAAEFLREGFIPDRVVEILPSVIGDGRKDTDADHGDPLVVRQIDHEADGA